MGKQQDLSIGTSDVGRAAFKAAEDEKLIQVHNQKHDLGDGKFGRQVLKDAILTALKLERTWVVGMLQIIYTGRIKTDGYKLWS